ncbi:MAG: hypothetical protein NT103_02430 [Campylobacterales bacterium]|nr:hypothetical protein [Campylobacterales bacterium]
MFEGLSLDQAPPLSVVMRFFLTVPVFGLFLSLLMIFAPHDVLTLSHPLSLASIHLLFLGIISMGMLGALFQMQSVLGGKPIPQPQGSSLIIHTLFTLGTLSLVCAFAFGISELFIVAGVFLGSAIVYFAQILLPLLFGSITHDTLKGMRLAVIALLLTATLGIVMATSYASGVFGEYHALIRTTHYSLGLIGWIAMLIVHVAFQVVEMFYVTTPYSAWCKHNVGRILVGVLALKVLWLFLNLPFPWVTDMIVISLLLGFVVTTMKRLQMRKRRVSDVSIWFWRGGIALLGIALMSYTGYVLSDYASLETVSLIAFALFALSIILGMMGKIVPFLVWFHLSSSGFMDTPIMSNIIPQKRSKILFWLFSTTVIFALLAPFYTNILILCGLTSTAMFALLLFNLIAAKRLYHHTLRHGTKFSFEN